MVQSCFRDVPSQALLSLAAVLFVGGSVSAQDAPQSPVEKARPVIPIADLARAQIIGQIGVPLGECATIEAEIVSGDSLRTKADAGLYLLRVHSANGKPLKAPVLLNLSKHVFGKLDLPNEHFSLYKAKTGRDAVRLTSEQVRELEKDYVGKKFKLLAYETGEFTGIPSKLPRDGFAPWADRSFGFQSHLMIMGEAK